MICWAFRALGHAGTAHDDALDELAIFIGQSRRVERHDAMFDDPDMSDVGDQRESPTPAACAAAGVSGNASGWLYPCCLMPQAVCRCITRVCLRCSDGSHCSFSTDTPRWERCSRLCSHAPSGDDRSASGRPISDVLVRCLWVPQVANCLPGRLVLVWPAACSAQIAKPSFSPCVSASSVSFFRLGVASRPLPARSAFAHHLAALASTARCAR